MNSYKQNSEDCLLQQSSYAEQYKLITESTLMMGVKNPPVKTTIEAEVNYIQTVENKGSITAIEVSNLKGTCSNPAMSNSLQDLYIVSGINPRLVVRRNRDGNVRGIENMNEMENEWLYWKENKLKDFMPNARKQTKFIQNYECGLRELGRSVERNLQYTLLFPECYLFKSYSSPDDKSNGKLYFSRFIENLHIPYRLFKKSHKNTAEGLKMSMESVLPDGIEIKSKSFYSESLPDFSAEDYSFSIHVDYLFEPNTSKMINGKLTLCETLHSNFFYNVVISFIPLYIVEE